MFEDASTDALYLEGQGREDLGFSIGDGGWALHLLSNDAAVGSGHDRHHEARQGQDAIALIQYTSGSTSDPRGVMVTHRNLLSNIEAAQSAAEFSRGEDRFGSWLPLFHDMGLIGFVIIPMVLGIDLVLMDPATFSADPASWLRMLSAYRVTITGAPNFAYSLAARFLKSAGQLDLSSVRLAFNGAEPIDPNSLRRFVAAAQRVGLDPNAMYPVYGMAEATLAITFPRPGGGARFDRVSRAHLEGALLPPEGADTVELVRLGQPIPGVTLRLVDADGQIVDVERRVGEVQIQSESVTPGYFNRPEETAKILRDGWLHTGDLGYMIDGELVLCGRASDLIIVAGRNIHPQDVERAIGQLPEVRPGGIAAFGVPRSGVERVSVVVEQRVAAPSLERRIRELLLSQLSLSPHDVVLVPKGAVPKTSSGKLQRSRARDLYLAGAFDQLRYGEDAQPGQ